MAGLGGHGPLAYVGEVFCEAVTKFELDISLPSSGRMLFFYFDGSYDNFQSTVGTWDAETLAGTRLIYLPDDAESPERNTPDGLRQYVESSFGGLPVVTEPNWEHPALRSEFMDPAQSPRSWLDHPVNADALQEALSERHKGWSHQVGGYLQPDQNPVEHEVALAALNNDVPYSDPRLEEEAAQWTLIFQLDSDDSLDMMWGDVGKLYWLARRDHLEDGDLSRTLFTWQCA